MTDTDGEPYVESGRLRRPLVVGGRVNGDDTSDEAVSYAVERAGFYVVAGLPRDEIWASLTGGAELTDDERAAIAAAVDAAIAAHAITEGGWHDATTNDRISAAFAELNGRGVVAMEHAGFTMSEGWSIVSEAAEDVPGATAAVFFHEQDVERGVEGHGLMLAFGAFDDGPDHAPLSHALAVDVCRTLRRHGVLCDWAGDIDRRIEVAPFAWRKRRATKAPPYALVDDDAATEPSAWRHPPAPRATAPAPRTPKPWWRFWQ